MDSRLRGNDKRNAGMTEGTESGFPQEFTLEKSGTDPPAGGDGGGGETMLRD